MNNFKYAVVRAYESTGRMTFSKFHDDKEEAFTEAERLAKINQNRFFVLKLIGYVDLAPSLVKREEFENVPENKTRELED